MLEWYGIDVTKLPGDSATLGAGQTTHLINFSGQGNSGEVLLPLALDPGIDLKRTTYLSRMIQRWGKLPLMLLNSMDLKGHRYAYIGTDDWRMHPLISPGSLVLIDETKRKIVNTGWTNEFERPIYFFERRDGYTVGWATLNDNVLIVQPHPAVGKLRRRFLNSPPRSMWSAKSLELLCVSIRDGDAVRVPEDLQHAPEIDKEEFLVGSRELTEASGCDTDSVATRYRPRRRVHPPAPSDTAPDRLSAAPDRNSSHSRKVSS